MHIFLSALESSHASVSDGGECVAEILARNGIRMKYNLISYFAIHEHEKRRAAAYFIRDNSEEILIDSGAHSFQKGKRVSWDEYTDRYCDFIRQFDRPNVLGYFEMDVDKIIGLAKVSELRKRLERVTDKIIPVWHKGRGIADFKAMCESHKGRIVAITGFANEDIKDEQYMMFVRHARKCGCRIHCLGMTRKKVLDKVPFDYTDSSTWLQRALFGITVNNAKQRASRSFSKAHYGAVFVRSYINAMKDQNHYEEKWRKEHNWLFRLCYNTA